MKLRIFTEPQQGASYDQLLAVAGRAEQLGFDAFFRSDHYLKMHDRDGLPGPTDAWITLAGLARDTRTIRLGTLVSPVTFRHPGPLAISVAQVDQMSGGRVELGLGTGWFDAEHAAYGLDFPPIGERFAVLEEQLAIVTGMWATPIGATFDFAGQRYRVSDSPALPKPSQRPRPPIIIGGGGPTRTPKLAARYADEFNRFAGVDESGQQFDRVRAACETIGRDPATMRFSVAQTVCAGADEAEVGRRAKAIGSDPARARRNGLAGTPGEILEKIEAFRAIGAERVYLQVLDLDDLEHLDLLAAEVLPYV